MAGVRFNDDDDAKSNKSNANGADPQASGEPGKVHKLRCICQICTCGRHRCPIHRSRGPPHALDDSIPCGLTEYKSKYVPKQGEFVESCKPKVGEWAGHDIPLESATTNHTDYVPWPLNMVESCKPKHIYQPTGDMDLRTVNQDTYIAFPGAHPPLPCLPKYNRMGGGEFTDETTQKTDYKQWPMDMVDSFKPSMRYKPTPGLTGTTTQKTDFPGYRDDMRVKSFKPSQLYKQPKDAMDGHTMYRDEYGPKQIPERFHRDPRLWKKPEGEMSGLTTHKVDYPAKHGEMVESFRPKNNNYFGDEAPPMSGDTTSRSDYTQKPINMTENFKPKTFARPTGDMDMTTVNMQTYTGHPGALPADAIKPKRRSMGGGEFSDETTHKTDYKQWPMQALESFQEKRVYKQPNIPMSGVTTNQSDYQRPDATGRSDSFKPSSKYSAPTVPMEGDTTYHTEYTEKHAGPCPAALCIAGQEHQAGYERTEKFKSGHKLYERHSSLLVLH